tara:strand:+ start:58 stop:273 length:216 start_codon:yes stop_codon:yes gene_type:complete
MRLPRYELSTDESYDTTMEEVSEDGDWIDALEVDHLLDLIREQVEHLRGAETGGDVAEVVMALDALLHSTP